jgi:hypothetical protein
MILEDNELAYDTSFLFFYFLFLEWSSRTRDLLTYLYFTYFTSLLSTQVEWLQKQAHADRSRLLELKLPGDMLDSEVRIMTRCSACY